MSPRRALATAAVMAVCPTIIFVGGIRKYSDHICEQFADQLKISEAISEKGGTSCIKTIEKEQWAAFYWVLLASLLVNWPVIRWLDDRQWYREWIKEEEAD